MSQTFSPEFTELMKTFHPELQEAITQRWAREFKSTKEFEEDYMKNVHKKEDNS